MKSREPEQDLSALLHSLAGAAAEEEPSPAVEARLMEEFRRRQPASLAAGPASSGRRMGRGRRLSASGWLAAAASLVLLAAVGAGWRAWVAAPVTAVSSAGREGDRPAPLAAEAIRPDVPAPALAPATARPAAGEDREAKRAVGRVKRPVPRDTGIEFVAWPGAATLPPFESGELVRTELPSSVLSLLGIRDDGLAGARVVVADVIVGQDRMPRAVRIVR